jgi:hypothetical protein
LVMLVKELAACGKLKRKDNPWTDVSKNSIE